MVKQLEREQEGLLPAWGFCSRPDKGDQHMRPTDTPSDTGQLLGPLYRLPHLWPAGVHEGLALWNDISITQGNTTAGCLRGASVRVP